MVKALIRTTQHRPRIFQRWHGKGTNSELSKPATDQGIFQRWHGKGTNQN
uniref:Uncharacterized protein n=1 Tax=Vibrio sp. FF_307 TaxID=1652834 RepID=A0A0H3ZRW0_9VIBR|nr:hypothetical protein [Vibrio sp. FF_307]